MTDKEVMQMAMTALQENWRTDQGDLAIEALRTALVQPESAECDGGKCGIGGYCKQCPKTQPDVPESCFGETEPVAWVSDREARMVWWNDKFTHISQAPPRNTPLYTAPPQREWVGLTDDEYELMAEKRVTNYFFNTLDYAHDIEAKLKEKNNV